MLALDKGKVKALSAIITILPVAQSKCNIEGLYLALG
jgi:hypothetical protein